MRTELIVAILKRFKKHELQINQGEAPWTLSQLWFTQSHPKKYQGGSRKTLSLDEVTFLPKPVPGAPSSHMGGLYVAKQKTCAPRCVLGWSGSIKGWLLKGFDS
jgi:hypothetical protein